MAQNVRQHRDDRNLRPRDLLISIDGSALATSAGSGGVLIGADSVTANDDGSNTVTITFNTPMRNSEYSVFFQPRTTDCICRVASRAAGNFTYTSLELDGTTAEADADVDILIRYYDNSVSPI